MGAGIHAFMDGSVDASMCETEEDYWRNVQAELGEQYSAPEPFPLQQHPRPDAPCLASFKLPPGLLSSTRAEQWAIIGALCLSPVSSKVRIFTDSMAAVHAVKRLVLPTEVGMRRLIRSGGCIDWDTARAIAEERRLRIDVQWVKGHDGDVGNESADRLAGAAARDLVQSVDIDPSFQAQRTRIRHVLHFDGKPVNTDPRRFIKYAWQRRIHAWLATKAATFVDMSNADHRLMRDIFHSGGNAHDRKTSVAANKLISFRSRLLVAGLPTRSRNHEWWPHKYPSPNCPACGSVDDSQHWLKCTSAAPVLHETRFASLHDLTRYLDHVRVANPQHAATAIINEWWNAPTLLQIVTGTIRLSRVKDMYACLAAKDAAVPMRQIMVQILAHLGHLLHTHVWHDHCCRVAELAPVQDVLPPQLDRPIADRRDRKTAAAKRNMGYCSSCRESMRDHVEDVCPVVQGASSRVDADARTMRTLVGLAEAW